MKKTIHILLKVAGLILVIGCQIIMMIVSMVFPQMKAEIGMPIMFLLLFLGIIFLTFSLTMARMEKGTVKAGNLLRALTPAQAVLLVSSLLLISQIVLQLAGVKPFEVVGSFAMTGVMVAAFLAFIRASKNRSMRKKAAAEKERSFRSITNTQTPKTTNAGPAASPTPPTAPPPSPQRDPALVKRCERCENELPLLALSYFNGKLYCKTCLNAVKNEPVIPAAPKPKETCSVCGAEFEKEKLIMVDDRYYCAECICTSFPDSASDDDGPDLQIF